MTIRLAAEEDMDAVWALVSRAVAHMNALGNPQWGEDYPLRIDFEEDRARGELYLAVDDDGTILGCVCLNGRESPEYAPLPWRDAGPALMLHRLAVDPKAQRRGVGRALFAYYEDKARREGCTSLRLDTYGQNDRMRSLIESRGFEQVGMVHFNRVGRPLGFPCFEKVL